MNKNTYIIGGFILVGLVGYGIYWQLRLPNIEIIDVDKKTGLIKYKMTAGGKGIKSGEFRYGSTSVGWKSGDYSFIVKGNEGDTNKYVHFIIKKEGKTLLQKTVYL